MLWRALARRFPVLAIRDFRLLLADRLLAPAAFAFSLVGVSFAVLDISGSTADLSYVLAAQIAPSLVFTLISGVIADRVPPQRVIIAANIMIAVGEGTLGILVLTGQAVLWQMIVLETLTGVGMAVFWPASQALLPKIVPDTLLQQANALSRLAMNGAQMGGAAVAGVVVAAVGPGWALSVCGVGLLSTIPLLLAIRVTGHDRVRNAGMLGELRDGWSEFISHTWLWAIVAQFSVIMMAWYGGFQVLGPAVAKAHLGGPAAWGAIASAEALGLIIGGVLSLRFTPRRPMLFVVCIGAAMSISPLSLAMHWPLPALCLAAVFLGVIMEIMMVQWSVALARNVPPDKLARVSAYDALGSVMAMPLGALVAGPIAAEIGLSATQYGAAVLMVAASALALLSREVRTMRSPVILDTNGEPSVAAEPGPR
ncbi:MFS transporter [Sphaerisporangium sp. NPDC088356]|uniref:MFS transporter n=1 Tax=Sphaerisporangium sp. NPDC088356 TaxID=3154871 RepID=UPI00343BE0F8